MLTFRMRTPGLVTHRGVHPDKELNVILKTKDTPGFCWACHKSQSFPPPRSVCSPVMHWANASLFHYAAGLGPSQQDCLGSIHMRQLRRQAGLASPNVVGGVRLSSARWHQT
jgi:hypothetical protein